MITDLLDRNIAKIMTLFSISPGSKFTRNEIKEKTMLNNPPLDGALAVLLKNRILSREKRLFGINFSNSAAMSALDFVKKEHTRFREIPLAVYCLLIDMCGSLSKSESVKNIYLFGSYAKLVYTEKSDIDLAVIVKNEERQLREKIRAEIGKVERKYGKTVQAHFFEKNDMENNDPLIKEIKKNGIPLF